MKSARGAVCLWLCATAVVALLSSAFPSFSHASPAGYRIVLKSGEELSSVTFVRDDRLKVLRLQTPTKDRAIGFLDIKAIYDGDRDVTQGILGGAMPTGAPAPDSAAARLGAPSTAPPEAASSAGAPAASAGPWISDNSEAYRSVDAPRWQGAVYAGANFSAPIGSYYDGFTSGVGFDVDGLVPVARHLGMRASVSRSGIRPGSGLRSFGVSASIMRYSLAVLYFQHRNDALSDRSMLYAYYGLGAGVHTLSGSYGSSDSQARFLMTSGLGYIKALGSSMGLNAGVGLDNVFVPAANGDSSTALIVDVKSGLIFLF